MHAAVIRVAALITTRDAHGYPDIRKNPDNKLSGYMQIINYPFNYPPIWRLILFMYFLCSFSKFLRYFAKILYINSSISKILAAGLGRTSLPLGYTSATLRYPLPYRPHDEFVILFDFRASSVKSLLTCQLSGDHILLITLTRLKQFRDVQHDL